MKISPKLTALSAALLFGVSAPVSKLLLKDFKPLQLAGILYLGSGVGLGLIKALQILIFKKQDDASRINGKDIKWLAGAVLCGGIIAPVLLMLGLSKTPASTASLLLNFEAVSTAVIAFLFFKERIGKKLWAAILCITIASIVLSLDLSGKWGFSVGSAGILLACALWGLDNNFTRKISYKDPYVIVMVKGLVSGAFSIGLSISLGYHLPGWDKMLAGLMLGFLTYGLSLFLFVLSLRRMGSSRTSAFFGLAPFLGTIISLILFQEFGNILFFISFPLMALGAYLLFNDKHRHPHRHSGLVHEHSHSHDEVHEPFGPDDNHRHEH